MELWPDKSELQQETLTEILAVLREIRDLLKPRRKPIKEAKANESAKMDS